MDELDEKKITDSDISEYTYNNTHSAPKRGGATRAVTLIGALLYLAAYGTIMAFSFARGIDPDVVIWAILLYALSAAVWAPHFLYLLNGKQYFIFELMMSKAKRLWSKILCHTIMIILPLALVAIQFLY